MVTAVSSSCSRPRSSRAPRSTSCRLLPVARRSPTTAARRRPASPLVPNSLVDRDDHHALGPVLRQPGGLHAGEVPVPRPPPRLPGHPVHADGADRDARPAVVRHAANLGWLDTYWGIMFPGHDDGVRDLPHEAVLRERAGRAPRGRPRRRARRVPDLVAHRHAAGGARPLGARDLHLPRNWTAFLWPLISTTRRELYTLPVGLSSSPASSGQWEMVMTGASVATLPMLLGLPPAPEVHRPRRHADRPQGLGAGAMTVAARRPRPSPVLGVPEYACGGLGPASLGCSVLAPARGSTAPSRAG